MQTTTRIQTAFRLDRNLVSRLKLKARRENKSLNKLVEDALMKTAPAELEWPKVEFPLKPSPLVDGLRIEGSLGWTKEEIKADPKLEYLLTKHAGYEDLP